MDHPSSSSPRRDVPAPQDDEIELIASQMEWHNDQSRNEHFDNGQESGDELGPGIGEGGSWQGNVWIGPIDPHPSAPIERRSEEALDLDYEPEPRQVMHTRFNPYYTFS